MDAPCGTPASFFKLPHQTNHEGAIPAPEITVLVGLSDACDNFDTSYIKLKLSI